MNRNPALHYYSSSSMNATFIYTVSSLLVTLVETLTLPVTGAAGEVSKVSIKSPPMQTVFTPMNNGENNPQ